MRNRGDAWSKKGDNDRAIADYDVAIRIDPTSADTFKSRGDAWSNKKEYDRAISDYDAAIQLDPDFGTNYVARANALDSKGEHDRAIADYSKAISLDKTLDAAFHRRGGAYRSKFELDLAIADLTEAIRLDPKYAGSHPLSVASLVAGKGRLCARPRRLQPKPSASNPAQCGQISRARRRAEQQRSVRSGHGRLREGDGPSIPRTRAPILAGPTSGRTWATALAPSPTTAKPFGRDPNERRFDMPGRAFTYRNGGDWDRAIAHLSEAIRLDPKEPGR